MANDFPSPIVPPDPNRFGPGQKLLAETTNCFQDLAESHNHGHAWFGAGTVVAQGYGESVATTTVAMPVAGTWHSNWRFPKIGTAWASVEVEVRATKAGAGDGSIRFQSVAGAATLTLAIPAAATSWVSGTLAVAYDATTKAEEVNMTIAGGAAATATTLHEVFINYVPLTTPLAAAGSDGFTPFDAAEIDADSVCSSDVGIYMRNNLRTFLGDADDLTNYPGRKRVAYQWADLGSAGTGAATAIKTGMTIAEHRVLRPVHYGALQNAHTMTVYVEATGAGGAAKIYLYHGGESPGHPAESSGRYSTLISVGAGAARQWYTTTFNIDDTHRHIGNIRFPSSFLSVWPGTRSNGDIGNFSPGRVQNSNATQATIHAVSAWCY